MILTLFITFPHPFKITLSENLIPSLAYQSFVVRNSQVWCKGFADNQQEKEYKRYRISWKLLSVIISHKISTDTNEVEELGITTHMKE